jgi:hypothetical protein
MPVIHRPGLRGVGGGVEFHPVRPAAGPGRADERAKIKKPARVAGFDFKLEISGLKFRFEILK